MKAGLLSSLEVLSVGGPLLQRGATVVRGVLREGLQAVPDGARAHGRSPKHSKPEVDIKPCMQTGYWIISVICKDRNKLLFDTVRLQPW